MFLFVKLGNISWRSAARTLRTYLLSSCNSTRICVILFPCLEHCTGAHKVDLSLREARRVATTIVNPTRPRQFYILTGTASPKIHRKVGVWFEMLMTKTMSSEAHFNILRISIKSACTIKKLSRNEILYSRNRLLTSSGNS